MNFLLETVNLHRPAIPHKSILLRHQSSPRSPKIVRFLYRRHPALSLSLPLEALADQDPLDLAHKIINQLADQLSPEDLTVLNQVSATHSTASLSACPILKAQRDQKVLNQELEHSVRASAPPAKM